MKSLALSTEAQTVVNRGIAWLIERENADGSFAECGSELVSSYKALLAFAKAGKVEEGIRCLRYIQKNNVNADGELSSGDGSIKTNFPGNQRNFANYMDGWVAIGSWLLGDYKFATTICDGLIKQQASHGGVLTGPKKWCGQPRYDILTAASCGRAFLITGKLKEAIKVADFISDVLKRQRTPDKSLDMSFDENWKHVETPSAEDRVYYRLDYDSKGERVFCPAFSCAFLCEISQISQNKEHLAAARKYLTVIEQTPEFKAKTLANGKSAWAAGMLAIAAKDKDAERAALAIMPQMLARQKADGAFGSGDQTPFAKVIESTAEHAAWSLEYVKLLAMGLGTGD
jgi:hypothetical protein